MMISVTGWMYLDGRKCYRLSLPRKNPMTAQIAYQQATMEQQMAMQQAACSVRGLFGRTAGFMTGVSGFMTGVSGRFGGFK